MDHLDVIGAVGEANAAGREQKTPKVPWNTCVWCEGSCISREEEDGSGDIFAADILAFLYSTEIVLVATVGIG